MVNRNLRLKRQVKVWASDGWSS